MHEQKVNEPQKNNTASQSNQSKQMPSMRTSHSASIIQRATNEPQSLT